MPKIGDFQIQSQVNIAGRGLVILGQILEGKVNAGSTIQFEVDGVNISMQIANVEFADNISERKSWVGLVVAPKNEDQKQFIQYKEIKEQIAEIIE